MISRMKIIDGFPLKFEFFKKETKFKPGLNILFGPNGCGKTTALRIIGTYSGIQDKGWSVAPNPHHDKKDVEYPKCFANRCIGKVDAEVDWDGRPSYFSTSTGEVVVPSHFEDGNIAEQMQIIRDRPSSGQLRLYYIDKMIGSLTPKTVPDLTIADIKGVNNVWQETRQKFADYVKTLPRNGPITLLLDEPDKCLSIPVQYDLWATAIPQWAVNVQVIVATHSPFCLMAPGANIIECVSGYLNDCKTVIKEFEKLK